MNEQPLKTRYDIHRTRKIFHFCGVLFIIVLFHNLSRTAALQLASFGSFLILFIDILRLQSPATNRFVISTIGSVMRERERNKFSGSSYMMLGVFTIILFFPRPIVHLSLFFLAIADPLASYVGILHGKDRLFRNKTLQGSLAAFVACTLIAASFYFSQNLMTERLLVVSLLSGLIGAVAELFPIGKLDDNFSLPVVSSCLLWVVFYVFGGF